MVSGDTFARMISGFTNDIQHSNSLTSNQNNINQPNSTNALIYGWVPQNENKAKDVDRLAD